MHPTASSPTKRIPEACWRAIEQNDASFDGMFYYAVITTGIVCRPSCKSRLPRKEHVRLYNEVADALGEGFRPCKRCTPDAPQSPEAAWATEIAKWLDQHYASPVTLESLAGQFHGSPYHLQRSFKRVIGVTPLQYIQRIRIRAAQAALQTSRPLAAIAAEVGLANAAYLSTLFHRHTGQSPSQYRKMLLAAQGTDCTIQESKQTE